MYIPIWVICLVGGWLGGLASAYGLGAYLTHRERKQKQISDKNVRCEMKSIADHGQN